MKLVDARVLLTGAAGGIGVPVAQGLVRAGAQITLLGRNPATLKLLADQLAAPKQVQMLVADLNQAEDLARIVDHARTAGINVLINNAGLPSFGALGELSTAHLAAVLHTNLLAPMQLTQALLPHLQSRPRAIILNVGSVLGRLGLPGHSVYCAAKFGLHGFSEALRRELAGSSVQVLHLAPRATRTAFNDARVTAYHQATGTHSDAPEQVAAALLDQLVSESPEVILGFPEKLAVRLNGAAPLLLDRAFRPHRDALIRPQPQEKTS